MYMNINIVKINLIFYFQLEICFIMFIGYHIWELNVKRTRQNFMVEHTFSWICQRSAFHSVELVFQKLMSIIIWRMMLLASCKGSWKCDISCKEVFIFVYSAKLDFILKYTASLMKVHLELMGWRYRSWVSTYTD